MAQLDFTALKKQQSDFFYSGITQEVDFRKNALKKLQGAVQKYESRIIEGLRKDLGKSDFESYAAEIGLVYEELRFHIRNVGKWSRGEKVSTNQVVNFWSSSRIVPEPFGNTLIIAPWNYPFQLVMMPLIGAVSAGNTAVIKPSEFTPSTAAVLEEMIASVFDEKYIVVVNGDADTSAALLKLKWDKIFFTGSPRVGQIVAEAAAGMLTPVTLELGGKSPSVVTETAKIDVAAKRIIWGKMLNAGQTCIAPDYVLVQEKVKEKFVDRLIYWIEHFYGKTAEKSPDFPRIVNERHTQRIKEYIENSDVLYGGKVMEEERFIAPALLDVKDMNVPVMQDEIFGPVLPIVTYNDLEEVIAFINSRPKPLALYLFSEDNKEHRQILKYTSSGSMGINETVMQVANNRLPFGGVGNSGMGNYHGKFSFDCFSHQRSVLKKITWLDIPLRYPPYGNKLKLVRKFLK